LNSRQTKALQALIELQIRSETELKASDLAAILKLSRDSVHQLLLPLVRQGWVVAGRGRTGGYRVAPRALGVPVLSVLGLFSRDGAPLSGRGDPSLPQAIRQLDREACEAYRRILFSVTIGGLADRARAEREMPTYSI